MKKSMSLLIVLSLLIGIVITVASSHIGGNSSDIKVATNCGYSVSSQTSERTTLSGCLLLTYGWPAKYITSGVKVFLSDYHTEVPNNPSNTSSVIAYTSISRLRFIADWVLWSVSAGLVAAIGTSTLSKSKAKPVRSKK